MPSPQRDLDAFVAFHDPDCEIQPLLADVRGSYHGHDGVREWLDDLFGAFPDFSFRPDEVRELGDRTLAAARISAHGAHGMDSTAPIIDQVNWILAEWSNEAVVWWGTYRSEAEALEQWGCGSSALPARRQIRASTDRRLWPAALDG